MSASRTDRAGAIRLLCPTCGKRFTRADTDYPPFCTERCKLLDLANWLDERYRIPGEPAPPGVIDPEGEDSGG